jgi:hypothetical protein
MNAESGGAADGRKRACDRLIFEQELLDPGNPITQGGKTCEKLAYLY